MYNISWFYLLMEISITGTHVLWVENAVPARDPHYVTGMMEAPVSGKKSGKQVLLKRLCM